MGKHSRSKSVRGVRGGGTEVDFTAKKTLIGTVANGSEHNLGHPFLCGYGWNYCLRLLSEKC